MMKDGLHYVEGYVYQNENSMKVAHAWNADSKGNHFDFTLKEDAKSWKYFGVIIPNETVQRVGFENGGMWYSVLPFIESIDEIAPIEQRQP
jgi:hypothetical protein